MLTLTIVAVMVGVVLAITVATMRRYNSPATPDKAEQKASRWRLVTKIIAISSVLFVALACVSLLDVLNAINRMPEPIPFSIEGWNSTRYDAKGYFTYTRYKMVQDLLKRYDFHGWSMADVERLLNKPDDEKDVNQKHLVYYDLGNGIEFLILQVDAERRVVNYYLHLD